MPAKIMNEKQLDLFLKILAQESVKKAYASELMESYSLFEKDEEEDPLFGGGDEEGEEGGEGDEGGGEEAGGDDPLADLGGGDEEGEEATPAEPAAEEPAEEPEEPKNDKVQIRPTPLTLELGEITSDGLLATLNMIRAGRSFKEPDIAAELEKYFEKQLNDSERLALATFLSAIRDLTSGSTAEDVPDPGDENVNIDATDREKRQNQPEKIPGSPSQPQTRTRPRPAMGPGGIEDTSPPIKVGQRDAYLAEEYRKHIRSLLIG